MLLANQMSIPTPRWQTLLGKPVIDVTAAPYNADTTGAVSAVAAISAAAAAADAAGGGIVYIPAGTYLLSLTSGAPDYALTLDGLTDVHIWCSLGATFTSTPTNSSTIVLLTNALRCSWTGGRFVDSTFDGLYNSGGTFLTQYGDAFTVGDGCSDVIVRDVRTVGFFRPFRVHGESTAPQTVVLENCRAEGCRSWGFEAGEANGVQFVGCEANKSGLDGFKVTFAQQDDGVLIHRCRAMDVGQWAIIVDNAGYNGDGIDLYYGGRSVTITDFVALTGRGSGINIKSGNNAGSPVDPQTTQVIISNVRVFDFMDAGALGDALGNGIGIGTHSSEGYASHITVSNVLAVRCGTGVKTENARNIQMSNVTLLDNARDGFYIGDNTYDMTVQSADICGVEQRSSPTNAGYGIKSYGDRITFRDVKYNGCAFNATLIDDWSTASNSNSRGAIRVYGGDRFTCDGLSARKYSDTLPVTLSAGTNHVITLIKTNKADAGWVEQADIRNDETRGLLTIADANATGAVAFSTTKPSANYYVWAMIQSRTASAATSRVERISSIATTGFTVNLDTAPTSGQSVTVAWQIIPY